MEWWKTKLSLLIGINSAIPMLRFAAESGSVDAWSMSSESCLIKVPPALLALPPTRSFCIPAREE